MKLKKLAVKLSVAMGLLASVLVVSPVAAQAGVGTVAATGSSKQAICDGAGLSAKECSGSGTGGLNTIIKNILNILAAVVGVAAVIMIIISGFRYVTSAGDAAKVGAAKTTLIYALIGLAIVALAKTLVRFVFNTTT